MLGLCAYGQREELRDEARRLVRPLAAALFERYQDDRSEEWDWFLPVLTYGNARLPEALLRAGRYLDSEELIVAACKVWPFSIRFSIAMATFAPWGAMAGIRAMDECALFDQQPIDAGGMVEVNLVAYRLTRDPAFLGYAVTAMDWFYGRNVLRMPLYNPHSGGCHDGLIARGVNSNQGAESTLVYLMAQLNLYEQAPEFFTPDLPEVPEEPEKSAEHLGHSRDETLSCSCSCS